MKKTPWGMWLVAAVALLGALANIVVRLLPQPPSAPHVFGASVPIPTPGDAGTVLTSNGPGAAVSWSTVSSGGGTTDGSILQSSLFLSPVDIATGVAAAENKIGSTYVLSLNSQGSGLNTPVGIGFVPARGGMNCSGARIWWVPYSSFDGGTCNGLSNTDASGGSDPVKLELWQGSWNGSIWSTSSIASANITVNATGVYTGTWAPVALLAGRTYAVTAYDTATLNGGGIGAGGCYPVAYTQISSVRTEVYGALPNTGGNPVGIGASVTGYAFAQSSGGNWWNLYCNAGGDCAPINNLSGNGSGAQVLVPVEPILQ